MRSEKLRVIENVEALKPKLRGLRLGQPDILENCQILVAHPGPVKETPFGHARRTQGVISGWDIEIRPPVAGIVVIGENAPGPKDLTSLSANPSVGRGTETT
jgi:hypothetical protein